MNYQNELDFLLSFFKNYRLPVRICPINKKSTSFDLQLREKLNLLNEYDAIHNFLINDLQPACIYKITDQFFCSYYMLQLPDYSTPSILLIGPYIRQMQTKQIAAHMEKHNISPPLLKPILEFLYTLTAINNDAFLQTILETFGEKIWKTREAFVFKELDYSMQEISQNIDWPKLLSAQEKELFDLQAIEAYTTLENDLIHAVAQGLSEKADSILTSLITNHSEQFDISFLFYLKLQIISLNTLLRKAGEFNSVNLYHLSRLSSTYTQKLEQATSPNSCIRLLHEMVQQYCLAIQNHSMKDYSSLIQEVIKLTDSDPAADLSLRNIAKRLNVNPSYLSTLFHDETGKTLTEYVNQKRIQLALFLLNTTELQVQTIAQYCGINDVNYFTKLFKKYVHKSPTKYRKEIHKHL